MIKYFYQGGAYAEHTWYTTTKPTEEDWQLWGTGELILLKITNNNIYEPTHADNYDAWTIVKKAKEQQKP